MPQYNYPGVYIEEIPSGVRTITGVATSIAAFVGWAPQGPTDEARLVLSWSDYERIFGGLHRESALSYAVSHFFVNGGREAYILRVTSADATAASLTLGDLKLTATGPGKWGESYGVKIIPRLEKEKSFRLEVLRKAAEDGPEELVEVFDNVSVAPDHARFVESVVSEQSLLVNAQVTSEQATPPGQTEFTPLEGGENGTVIEAGSSEWATLFDAAESDADAAPVSLRTRLEQIDLFNLLCFPGVSNTTLLETAAKFCVERRAFLIIDGPPDPKRFDQMANFTPPSGEGVRNAALYWPPIKAPDPLQQGRLREFPPCGAVAGIYARTDSTRGVWKAPAGVEASLTGVRGPKIVLTDEQNGRLNPKAVNCIRAFPVYGTIVWGARTLDGNDQRGSEWKYVPVRRTALFIEETLYRSLKWVVFEPNDEPLWAQIRLNVGAFLHGLFRKGAFQGRTPREAYFVKCDKETTTQNDINQGIVNIIVGFAPLKPAEFVVVKLQQMAGQIEV